MPSLENIKCPVCGNLFQDGDDVVYCPDCGTPHHRECYKMAGHCVNAGLHNTGYNFYDENFGGSTAPQKSEPQESDEEELLIPSPFSPVRAEDIPEVTEEFDGDKIAGENAKDYAAAVRTNTERFIPMFKRFDKGEKKLGWNWGALFFGPYYLLFRKMYPQGIGFLCLDAAIMYLGSYFTVLKAPKYIEAMQNIVANSSKNVITAAEMQSAVNAADYDVARKISMIMLAVIIVVRIILALFADRFYFGNVRNLVKTVNERMKDDSTGTNIGMISITPQSIDSEKMKLLYLARRGGTSLMNALLGVILIMLIITF